MYNALIFLTLIAVDCVDFQRFPDFLVNRGKGQLLADEIALCGVGADHADRVRVGRLFLQPADEFLAFSELLQHRSEEHTSELQSLMRISYAVFCLKKKNKKTKP